MLVEALIAIAIGIVFAFVVGHFAGKEIHEKGYKKN